MLPAPANPPTLNIAWNPDINGRPAARSTPTARAFIATQRQADLHQCRAYMGSEKVGKCEAAVSITAHAITAKRNVLR
jgi:hypothetical protein